ncbi:uncharacterized protein LOC127704668 [Mytilus californianus]|uniref:uncharacterized protein LOC127704668 n=1 Tax=Mytilus californianus TaxID=6549 RepID=UPI00224724FB|nr:uncharacterized protein LOC127704668 [Mytilus californianus]
MLVMEVKDKIRYFIAKCANIKSLQTCINNSRWACRDRVTSPIQPREILSSAFQTSIVIIIFSVNNCHGWHGYVTMQSEPKIDANSDKEFDEDSEKSDDVAVGKEMLNTNNLKRDDDLSPWFYFNLKWITEYSSQFGEQCLPFQKTANFYCIDKMPLNKARNWHEIDKETGQELCKQMDEHYKKLKMKQEEKVKLHESRLPPPFMRPARNTENFIENWSQLVKKVENELGTVLLACPFGSQRYNLDTEKSDMDMFVIYQADTKSLLGFDKQPPQTVKSSEREALDYTVHEVYRYGELLLAGDHRCVETLFLQESSYVASSETIKQLLLKRHLFLNSLCLDKYLRDALGNKGLKLFEKWTKDKPYDLQMTERQSKLAYIIIRLLQNAKNVVDKEDLQVFRLKESPERNLLMSLKSMENIPPIQFVLDEINRLKNYIDENKDKVPEASEELKLFMNDWILTLRKERFI